MCDSHSISASAASCIPQPDLETSPARKTGPAIVPSWAGIRGDDMQVDPALLREWSTTVAAVSDDVGAVDVRAIFGAAATACKGTVLVRGLSTHAESEVATVSGYRDSLDAFSHEIRFAADELENADRSNAGHIESTQYP